MARAEKAGSQLRCAGSVSRSTGRSVAGSAYRRTSEARVSPRSLAKQALAAASEPRNLRRLTDKILAMAGLVMLFQQIQPKVALEIPPHAVHMIGVILRIVKFDQECRCLNAIVMRVPIFFAARPGKVQISTGLLHLLRANLRDLLGRVVDVFVHQILEQFALVRVQLGGRQPASLAG